MAITESEALGMVSGGSGGMLGGAMTGPLGGPNITERDMDLGGGRGRPGGGRQSGTSSIGPSGRGSGGQGYTEEDVNKILRNMPPEKIAAIQRQMQTSGLLPASARSNGFVDSATRTGFMEVLEYANTAGSSYETVLSRLEEGGKEMLAEARRTQAREAAASYIPPSRIYNQSDPEAVKQTAERAFKETLGRKPKPEELDRFMKSWQSMETAEQTQNFDAQEGADRYRFNATNAAAAGGGGDPVDSLLNAIGGQESGGDYGARNGRTGANGKYQIMPAIWPAWSAEAGLGARAPQTAENQEKVARFKMGKYVEEFGQEGAAVAWYAGPGAAKQWLQNSNTNQFNKKQGKGNEPSINEYVQQVMGRMSGAPEQSGSESEELMRRIQQMQKDAPGKLGVGPTTRSLAEQKAAKARERAGGPKAATPGKSKHGDGRANDLNYGGDENLRKWVLDNAYRYGLHFPVYDPSLKRSNDESWHVELKDYKGGGGAPMGVAAGGSPVGMVQQADLGAQATSFAENVNPDEKAAYDIGGQFNSFLSILQRGVV